MTPALLNILKGVMIVLAWHEKNTLEQAFPFHLWVAEASQFPHHWHEEIEIIYVIEGSYQIGLNNEVCCLNTRDILLIGSGQVHAFLNGPKPNKLAIVRFGLSLFDTYSNAMGDRKFVSPLLRDSRRLTNNGDAQVHQKLEQQILQLLDEYVEKKEGYRLALKARLYDLVVTLLRQVPMEQYSPLEKNRQISKLERLEKVFQYVEENYERDITLSQIAQVANFSPYHFAHFFKETTGVTFGAYLSNFRVSKAEWLLLNSECPVTEIAYKSGFNSIKTFNRIFKNLKGSSPSKYKKTIFEK